MRFNSLSFFFLLSHKNDEVFNEIPRVVKPLEPESGIVGARG